VCDGKTMNVLFLYIGPRLHVFAKRAQSVSCYLVGNYNVRQKLSHNHISNSRPVCMLRTETANDLVRRHLVVY
jgi:outer membrane protein OmpA-like peptidoglycan-associated protein